MAINNPLIPGDPFSYDLKWLVRRVRSHDESITAINEDISDIREEIAPYRNIYDYITQALKNEHIVYVTPEMYGAKGDGVANDTDAMKLALQNDYVMLAGTYLVDDTLHFSGCKIMGEGKIVCNAPVRFILDCSNTEYTYIQGIDIDAGARAAIPLRVSSKKVLIDAVKAHNTNNHLFNSIYSCVGILVYADSAIVQNCEVYDINRTKIDPGVEGSGGINVHTRYTSYIINNYVHGILCSAEQTDCDGIQAYSFNNEFDNVSVIENNRVENVSGRFVKCQTKAAHVVNNYLSNENATFTNAFFKAIDFQYGVIAEAKGNLIIMPRTAVSVSSMVFTTDNTTGTIMIENNVVDCGGDAQEIRNFFNINNAPDGLELTVQNNDWSKAYTDHMLYLQQGATNSTFVFRNNRGNIYRGLRSGSVDLETNNFIFSYNNIPSFTPLYANTYKFESLVFEGTNIVSVDCYLSIKPQRAVKCHLRSSHPLVASDTALNGKTDIWVETQSFLLAQYYDFSTSTGGYARIS